MSQPEAGLGPAGFPFRLAEYACPLINPPSQRGLFENKIHNIQLAIARFSPPELRPGQIFSFWDIAQAPTAENGFREGAMFINQQVRTSLGGGLCQLSGLIYNLALLSGCEIIERHNHSIDAYGEERYIPLGRDATVAYGRKNLRFRNPYDFPIYFELRVDDQRAWGHVWGEQPIAKQIRIETLLIRTLTSEATRWVADPALPLGQQNSVPGLTGKIVKAWRIFEKPELPPKREFLSSDHYACTPRYIRYGHPGQPSLVRKILDRMGMHG
jgi:vancomycin resistance protein YoaR